jgi:hypothetical protein
MAKNKAVQTIAEETLNLPTLKSRGRDSLDFHELSVWQIKKALEEAYDAGERASIVTLPTIN